MGRAVAACTFLIFLPQLSFLSRLILMGFMDLVKYVSVASGESKNVSFGWENHNSHGADGWDNRDKKQTT